MSSADSKRESGFASDVLKIASGTAFAQILSILATPIVTRLYGPDSYGLSALFVSIAGIVGAVACLRYELAIMLPKDEEEAANLLLASLIFAGVTSILTVPALLVAGQPLMELLRSPQLSPYLWLIPVAVFAYGSALSLNYWISRTRHFGKLSVARVASSITTTGTQLTAGFAGYASGGSLIVANIIGSAASSIILGLHVWQKDRYLLKGCLSKRKTMDGVKRYKKFPLIDTWSALINTVSWQLPIFLLSTFFSPEVVGYYSLSLMVLQFPANLIGNAISQVFFQRAAEARFEKKLSSVVENTVLHLAILGLFPMFLLSIIGKEAFIIIFGMAWSEAGVYSQILAIWIFITFVASPISTLFSIFEKQGALLLFNIILLAMRAGALAAGGLLNDARLAISFFAAIGVLIYFAALIWLLSIAEVPFLSVLKRLKDYLNYSILLIAVIIYSKWFMMLSPLFLIIIAGFTAIIYYILSINKNSELLDLFRNAIRNR